VFAEGRGTLLVFGLAVLCCAGFTWPDEVDRDEGEVLPTPEVGSILPVAAALPIVEVSALGSISLGAYARICDNLRGRDATSVEPEKLSLNLDINSLPSQPK
jgi:hypothetical protein